MTKILGHETTIFGLEMMVNTEQWSIFFYFEILCAPSEIPANLPGQFSHFGQISYHWAAAILKAHMEFQIEFFYTTFHHHL